MRKEEMPEESPNKYGNFEEDVDELADRLAGREPRKRYSPLGGFGISHSDEVDEDFLRIAGNPPDKYGR